MSPRSKSFWLALLAANSFAYAIEEPPAVTTAPIYLPYYDEDSWSLVRGSVISSDAEAKETTYTIFCPDTDDSDPPECDLSLEFPFVLVEGPDTVRFHGTHTSRLTANLECNLQGTTRATCSGYSSFNEGYSDGVHTGPTEVTWTSTYSGSEVEWGVLTMGELPHDPDPVTAVSSTPTDFVSMPIATNGDNAGASLDVSFKAALLAACCTLVVGWTL
ncbi:hypothetical protein FOCG_02641 [Fusarium oxysporum f. sp. radicis-lycopersici 26381]|uniref:Uncharacterized protein n=5 Tax=Fusarium oxysporum TaxID=5507 RepID=A0A2H3HMD5_FUSOX|nr:uncharacterized protein FOBCDRAFT_291887 [Fusarium oxysporum Fo47]EXA00717.1 hypothetical protein FOWG_00841 [Fusarium oxysporum f. sp. lycopersici MN25]EXL59403.1 hypothetical protein FOCG_02641 [Fusarium oxysporum f. sp. radicis-lycopersici 26381]KAF5266085.1 hypothetical protein FOXYS1_3076 [Fusarium oxysporum]PCD43767.1 hypothetical protein AU210_002856 [Fusarium oxysporum f. sp. radicis-cucumerinum]RKK18413.1 hypothetical protein BFJ65_g8715 [Fusarium oxysporum f. sp. cepae]RYC94448.1